MIVKAISRVGIASSRLARRVARVTVAGPNAPLRLKHVLSQQLSQSRSFIGLAATSSFNSFSLVNHACILSVTDASVAGRRMLQTKGDQELIEFLEDEISAEKKSHKKLPSLSPFEASFNDAEVTLTRKTGNETIIIKFNINNSVDSDDQDADEYTEETKTEQARMVSRPNFSVEIEHGGKVLSLSCSFAEQPYPDDQQPAQPEEDAYADVYTIDEISVYEGDFSETTYSAAGDILDGNLYDLLMNMLEDRGITNEFVQKLSDYSTSYEHQRYISLLENLKKFFK